MSNRELDEMFDLEHRLETLDLQIEVARRSALVDLKDYANLKRRREEMAAHLDRFEEANR